MGCPDAGVCPEVQCNGLDDDCDAGTLEDPPDGDGDGITLCAGDCDDTDIDEFPGQVWFADCDNDTEAQIPAVIDWSEVVTVLAMALGLSFAATIYPSWRAARLDPVEALRYE